MLRAIEVDVQSLREHFPQNISDVDLFANLKGSHRVFVSCDRKQRTREREAMAIQEAGLTSLWLGPFFSKLGFWQQARWLVIHWETIDGYVSGVTPGTCALLQQNGKSMPFQLKMPKSK